MAPSIEEQPTPADFDDAEPVARPGPRSRWAVGLVVGLLLGLFVGGNVPAIVGLAAVAAAVAALRAGDAALAGAAIGFGLTTMVVVALFLQNAQESQPVGVQLAGAIGVIGVIGGVAGTALAEESSGYIPKGASGVGVRLLTDFLRYNLSCY